MQYLAFINQPFYIAVRHNDFTIITVPYFNVCFVFFYLLLAGQAPVSGHLSPTPLVAAYEDHSRKRPAPVTDIFIASRGCPLKRASTVLHEPSCKGLPGCFGVGWPGCHVIAKLIFVVFNKHAEIPANSNQPG